MAGKAKKRVKVEKPTKTKNAKKIADSSPSKKVDKEFKNWGRAWQVSNLTLLGCLFILMVCPLIPTVLYITNHHFDSSLWSLYEFVASPETTTEMMLEKFPVFSWETTKIYYMWILFQVVLNMLPDICGYVIPGYVGGIREGAVTPAGRAPKYNVNGLQAWLITHGLWAANIFYFKLFRPAELFERLGSLSVICNISGYLLATFAYLKAYTFPTNARENKSSGSFVYDYMMGVEFHPRIGSWFDFKLFFNGRPGIVAWTLINLSAMSYQLEQYGKITDSMILINVLHAIYVVDYFWNEAWYLKTIDICHDHFGWYLAWGDLAWLPFTYTLQGIYLAYHPVDLGEVKTYSILVLGLVGYYIFRSANAQKDQFRKSPDTYKIAGMPAKYIKCSYFSSDGKKFQSTLLISGWWGIGRHMNYTGDLMGCLAYSLCCGTEHLLPYFYFIYMIILLVHRIYRDEHRLKAKYGDDWAKYTAHVPYRLLPGIY